VISSRALLVIVMTAAGGFIACSGDGAPSSPNNDDEALSGGRATVFDTSRMAYAQAVPGLSRAREEDFFVGNSIFNRGWVAAPASVESFDGLGPMFNATNCSACHFKDGRGRPPVQTGETFLSMLLRVSVPGRDEHGGPKADPVYGGQIQGNGISGVAAEGREEITYEESIVVLPDGERVSLRRPTYRLAEPAYGPLSSDVMISPRVAPAVYGLGLLEAISESTILEHADPDDRNGDGVSGRPNYVWNVRLGRSSIGRFGWKANQPTIEQQVAGAFNGDLGITSSLFPKDDCTTTERECGGALSGGSPELDDKLLASVVAYSHLLAVPARRHWKEPNVLRGRDLFAAIGCASCHLATVKTGDLAGFSELSQQTIHPYTDLLLHDMGEELADHRPDFEASGAEWRTAPLWGIGLIQTVNRHTFLLHDGRARNVLEAIVWHDGEARASRDRFMNLPKADRDAVLSFLESL